jgi:hypothetical protein
MLVLRYGIPFVSGLIERSQRKEEVTLAEWTALVAKIETPFDTLVPAAPAADLRGGGGGK